VPGPESRHALHLVRSWDSGSVPPPQTVLAADVSIRPLVIADAERLGTLIWSAFHGTVDDDYETPRDADLEALETLNGKWGPMLWAGSFAVESHDEFIGGVIAVRDTAHDLLPLMAFVLTDPSRQREGIGRRLVEECIAGLARDGIAEVHLAVVPANPARRLYERLGFDTVG
jgi:ribosomal protein S18 acetylase RimI-like enzyme